MRKRITRRRFMQGGAGGALALGMGLPLLAGCSGDDGSAPLADELDQSGVSLPLFQFSNAQRAALAAAVARLVPAEGPGDWSGADAGAVEYIELLLNALSFDGAPRIYGHGPRRARFAEFQKLSRVKLAGWRAEIERLRTLYTEGLDELNRLARGPLSLLPGDFAGLPLPVQDAILLSLDLQNTAFFQALFMHTMEGVYGHPVYGGNRDYIAWRTYCYEGDVHGVRFPNGHDPVADERPWDQFGGYTPEEMGSPGAACGSPLPIPAGVPAQSGSGTTGLDLLNQLVAELRQRGGR
jgi:gluconate 2-dehydrogenase gamma chain